MSLSPTTTKAAAIVDRFLADLEASESTASDDKQSVTAKQGK